MTWVPILCEILPKTSHLSNGILPENSIEESGLQLTSDVNGVGQGTSLGPVSFDREIETWDDICKLIFGCHAKKKETHDLIRDNRLNRRLR
eukprot:776074-Amorphochlora_amoeboformis.AAC.2